LARIGRRPQVDAFRLKQRGAEFEHALGDAVDAPRRLGFEPDKNHDEIGWRDRGQSLIADWREMLECAPADLLGTRIAQFRGAREPLCRDLAKGPGADAQGSPLAGFGPDAFSDGLAGL
jgi:hypothetical protein